MRLKKSRLTLHVRPGGTKGWQDRIEPRQASWIPIIIIAVTFFVMCGAIGGGGVVFWLSRDTTTNALEITEETDEPIALTITQEVTVSWTYPPTEPHIMTRVSYAESDTPTPSPTKHKATPTRTPTLITRHAPTQTPIQPIIRSTQIPIIIRINEQPTITPTLTATITPTLTPIQEPELLSPYIPVIPEETDETGF